jgi:MFS family permease
MPLLGDERGDSAALIGLHSTALALGTIVSGLTQRRLVARLGRRRTMWGGWAVVLAAVLLLTQQLAGTPPAAVTLLAAALAAWGGSSMLNASSPALMDHHGAGGAAAVTEANALAAGVGAVAPLVIGAALSAGAGWRVGLLLVLPIIAALWLVMRATPIPDAPPDPGGVGARPLPAAFWWAWAVVVLSVAVEFCWTIWGTTLVAERTGVSPALAAGALSAFILGIALGRLGGARLALRMATETLLLGALVVCGIGWALAWTASSLPLAVVGLGLAGLGVAVQFPLGVARAIDASAGQGDLATGRVSLGVGAAVGLAPFALGWLADRVGLQQAFLVVPALLVAAAGTLVLGERRTAGRGR